MKILYHHRTRGRGAEGVHIKGICDGLSELGHDVTLLSFPGAEPNLEKSDSPALNTSVKKKSLISKIAELTKLMPQFMFEILEIFYNIWAFFRVRKAFKETECDFIYERYSLFTFAGLIYSKLAKVDFIIEVNDSALVHRVRPLKLKWLAKKIEKFVFKNSTGIVFISSEFQRIAKSSYGQIANSIVSPNAANIKHFNHTKYSKHEAKKKLGIPESNIVAGYTGAFVHWHGIDWFIKKIVKDLKNHSNLTLLLVGDGVMLDPIKKIIDENNLSKQIILTGRVAHTELSLYLSAMDFGILPDSNTYGSPMKLFEFMAMGKAMVLPDFSPIKDVIVNNKTGWMFENGNHDSCIDKVLSLYKKEKHLKEVGDNAREFIVNQRQWIHNSKDLLKLLNNNKEK